MNDLTELATRLVACPQWRWMPGMLALHGRERWRYLAPSWIASGGWFGPFNAHFVPDLTDWATIGCLLEMLPSRWVTWQAPGCYVVDLNADTPNLARYQAATLGEAVARALLAIWGAR